MSYSSSSKNIALFVLGSRTTEYYQRRLKQLVQERDAEGINRSSPLPLTLIPCDFETINTLLPDQFEQLKPRLVAELAKIHTHNIDHILLPNITLHETIDLLPENTKNIDKLIHPVKETLRCLQQEKIKNVIIFSSLYGMNAPYLKTKLDYNNMLISAPSVEDQQFIDGLRRNIYASTETQTEIEAFNALIQKYKKNAVVILACTELSIANTIQSRSVIDMAKIQMVTAIQPHSPG